MFSPAVINSKPAQKHLDTIKADHASILEGMANQKVRVDAYNMQKQTEMATQNAMDSEMEKEKMVNTTTAKKNEMDFAMKQGELDIKRAALSATD